MTGKEFRKALKEQFKKLDLDDREIHLNSCSFFMGVTEGNLGKQIKELSDNGKMLDFILDGMNTGNKKYMFYLKDGDDASTMYVKVEQEV